MALPAAPAQAADGGPSITLDPDNGVPGTNVTVRGYNFTAEEEFSIYYYRNTARVRVLQVETDEDGDFKGTFIVPESYTGLHEVRVYAGTNLSAAQNFAVEPGLTVTPKKGPVGTNVTVEGHGFAEDEEDIEVRYYFDGNYTTIARNVSADEDGNWDRSFQIPLSAQGSHKIDAQGDDNSFTEVRDATFEVTPGISLDKSSGSPGESVAVTGRGFATRERDITILFAGEAVAREIRADDTGYWQGSFEVPEMPKAAYNITTEGEFTDKEDVSSVSFEIRPGLVLSPADGHVGTDLTAIGGGFATNKDVDVRYDGNKVATDRTNSKGSFTVTFGVPESRHGARQVTAEVDGVLEAAAVFTMESDRPEVPELISPPDKSRVGLMGKVTPTFEWSEVSDESGVRYSLQIGSSANVTADGFLTPIVSKEGLVGTNYTVNDTEALPYGTYYWIVQAVDRAGNKSDWTNPASLRVGLLPLWAFVVVIVAIVALIGALVYFFVFRRRIHYY